jgi:tripartite-type tricarboxylate transporter receptor subunit TctC
MRYMARMTWCVLAAVLVFSGPAQAQEPAFPNKPVRVIVSAAAGGITDIMARFMQEKLGRSLGQPVIVENKPGAGGIIAVDYVARSAPDGYTLVMVNVSNAAIAPWINKNLPYDPLNDFVGVAAVGEAPTIVAINDKVPVKTLKEFIEYAKNNPGKINYGSAGNGTGPHLAAEVLAHLTGIKMVHVPYKGAGPASVDLAAGQVQLGMIAIGSAKGQIAAGQVRVLAVAGNRRLAALPDVPTFDQAGVSGYDVTNWFGLLAPRGTPRDVVASLNSHINQVLDDSQVVQRFQDVGTLPIRESVQQFQKRIVTDHAKWRDVIRIAGITAQ